MFIVCGSKGEGWSPSLSICGFNDVTPRDKKDWKRTVEDTV